MTETQIHALRLLVPCTFQPGSFPKRFVRDLNSIVDKETRELTEKQKRYLWKLVYQYRKQHGNKWFTVHAQNLLEQYDLEDKENA